MDDANHNYTPLFKHIGALDIVVSVGEANKDHSIIARLPDLRKEVTLLKGWDCKKHEAHRLTKSGYTRSWGDWIAIVVQAARNAARAAYNVAFADAALDRVVFADADGSDSALTFPPVNAALVVLRKVLGATEEAAPADAARAALGAAKAAENALRAVDPSWFVNARDAAFYASAYHHTASNAILAGAPNNLARAAANDAARTGLRAFARAAYGANNAAEPVFFIDGYAPACRRAQNVALNDLVNRGAIAYVANNAKERNKFIKMVRSHVDNEYSANLANIKAALNDATNATNYACNASTNGARAATAAYSYIQAKAPVASATYAATTDDIPADTPAAGTSAATDAPRAVTPAATSTAKKAADPAATRNFQENQALAKAFVTNLQHTVVNHISLIGAQIAKFQPAGR